MFEMLPRFPRAAIEVGINRHTVCGNAKSMIPSAAA
jgi:hypothetical protein